MPGWTRFDTNGAARLDYFIMDGKKFSNEVIMSIGHQKDTSSDHLPLSLQMLISNKDLRIQRPWSVKQPRVTRNDSLPDLLQTLGLQGDGKFLSKCGKYFGR